MESVRCVILLNFFLSSKVMGVNPIIHGTTEKKTLAGSWAVSCVWLQNRSPRMFVRGRWRLGVRRLGNTVERGALRAGMWLLVRESYVRTENEKHVCQPKTHWQESSHTWKVRQTHHFHINNTNKQTNKNPEQKFFLRKMI